VSRLRQLGRRAALPSLVFVLCAAAYTATLGERVKGTSKNPHFVLLAESLLNGRLSLMENRPPGDNDWALHQGKWYVSFPPLPAVLLMPAVAVSGIRINDRLIWGLLAGLGPALLYLLLRRLRESGRSGRKPGEDLVLAALFAFGSVYFFSSVQGTTWFAAHVVICCLLPLYLLFSLDARRPLLAGFMLALCLATRPSVALAAPFFLVEALSAARRKDAPPVPDQVHALVRAFKWLSGVRWLSALRSLLLFSLPVLAVGGILMWMNQARFDDPFEFGHTYLQIKWRGRIQTWGLVNYHYLARNLSIFLAGLPWLTSTPPYLKIGGHGLALWFTTPALLLTLWPKRVSPTMVGLYLSAACVALLDLCYQNTGWIQFGYRFALDYMALLIALLALGGRRFGPGFYLFLLFAVAVNFFGAVTFDRMPQFYHQDMTQRIIFQPD
jgi:hypothetical protein